MSKKTKCILAVSGLVVLLAGIVAFILLEKSKKTETDQGFELWRELPFIYSSSAEEKTYTSYKEAFSETIQTKIYELKVGETSAEIQSAYVTEAKSPTAAVSYKTRTGECRILIMKFTDGRLYTVDEAVDFDGISPQNDLLIYKDCEITVLRSGIGAELGKQVIYDTFEGEYTAVKYNEYENGVAERMEETLSEYNENAKDFVLLSSEAVTENVYGYLGDTLGVTFEE